MHQAEPLYYIRNAEGLAHKENKKLKKTTIKINTYVHDSKNRILASHHRKETKPHPAKKKTTTGEVSPTNCYSYNASLKVIMARWRN